MTRRKGFLEEIFDIFFKPKPKTRKAPAKTTGTTRKALKVFAVYAPTITAVNINEAERYGSIDEMQSTRRTLPKGYAFSMYDRESAKLMSDYLRKALKERIEDGQLKPDALPSWWNTV